MMAAIWLQGKALGPGRRWVPPSASPDSTAAAAVACKRKESAAAAAAAANTLVSVNRASAQLNPDTHQETNDFGEREEVNIGRDAGIMCEPCNGRGWLLCDFCEGQKTNVRSEASNRIYRRCPNCKAVGYVLCSKCKVFKCVTYPDCGDGEL